MYTRPCRGQSVRCSIATKSLSAAGKHYSTVCAPSTAVLRMQQYPDLYGIAPTDDQKAKPKPHPTRGTSDRALLDLYDPDAFANAKFALCLFFSATRWRRSCRFFRYASRLFISVQKAHAQPRILCLQVLMSKARVFC